MHPNMRPRRSGLASSFIFAAVQRNKYTIWARCIWRSFRDPSMGPQIESTDTDFLEMPVIDVCAPYGISVGHLRCKHIGPVTPVCMCVVVCFGVGVRLSASMS
jgi:hypothetical protein